MRFKLTDASRITQHIVKQILRYVAKRQVFVALGQQASRLRFVCVWVSASRHPTKLKGINE